MGKLLIFHCKNCGKALTDSTCLEAYEQYTHLDSIITFNKISIPREKSQIVNLRALLEDEDRCKVFKETDIHLGSYIYCSCEELIGIYLETASTQLEYLRELYTLRYSSLMVFEKELQFDLPIKRKIRLLSDVASYNKVSYDTHTLNYQYTELKADYELKLEKERKRQQLIEEKRVLEEQRVLELEKIKVEQQQQQQQQQDVSFKHR